MLVMVRYATANMNINALRFGGRHRTRSNVLVCSMTYAQSGLLLHDMHRNAICNVQVA